MEEVVLALVKEIPIAGGILAAMFIMKSYIDRIIVMIDTRLADVAKAQDKTADALTEIKVSVARNGGSP